MARRESVRRKAVDTSGGQELENKIEVPPEAAEAAAEAESPKETEGKDAQAEDAQGAKEEG
jgi:hypothetical protein